MLELENFFSKFNSPDGHLCIVILNKKLFKIGQGDPESQADKIAYYGLIGYAYQNHMLEKVTATLEPGFKYTFMVNGKPKTLERTEDLMDQYSYCLNYIEQYSK
jgi:hypothetical protein